MERITTTRRVLVRPVDSDDPIPEGFKKVGVSYAWMAEVWVPITEPYDTLDKYLCCNICGAAMEIERGRP